MQNIEALHAYSINNARAEKLAKCFLGKVPAYDVTGRGVLFLTERCNFNCLYCKRAQYTQRDFGIDEAKQVVGRLADFKCKYLHLTGGEVTIFDGLEEIVCVAKERGMTSSLSTNGTGSPELYKKLVENGAKFFYVTLNTDNQSECDQMTGRKNTFEQIIATLNGLVGMRDAGKDIYLTVNVVVCDNNISRIEDIAHFVSGLRPDDFKLIPTTRLMHSLSNEQKEKIQHLAEKSSALREKYSFFNYRLSHFAEMRGLKDEKYKLSRCYVCMDERVYGPEHYWPCDIYFREKGKPLGRRSESLAAQADQAFEFAIRRNPSEDPICREFCCDITRDFNLAVHEMVENGG
jgi:MoaA/NifB/PqqE/SkfB family radical SAM enzyme